MTLQRGIAAGWLYLIGLVVVLGLLAAIIFGVKSYVNGVDRRAYDRGVQETTAKYAQRDNAALTAANARIQELQNAARSAERDHAERVAALEAQLQQEAANGRAQRESDIAAVRSGALQLRDPGTPAGTGLGCRGAGPEAVAGAGDGDAAAKRKLSGEASEFLLGLANEADDVVRQLHTCQAVVKEDRRTVNR